MITVVLFLFASSAFAQPPEQPPENQPPENQPPENQPPENQPPENQPPGNQETPPENELPPGHPPVPTGPAQAIGQVNQAIEDGAAERRELSEDDIHRGLSEPSPAGVANPDPNLPAGTIRVEVVNASGAPVPNANVELGVMSQDSQRSSESKRADAGGIAVFEDLPTGAGQAYRINVLHGGAKFSCTPFRLEDTGYTVRITQLPTTREDRNIMQMMSRVILEFHDDRVRVHQQIQLVNLGREQYVFPQEGKQVPLPRGFFAFQSQPMMTDQRVAAVIGEGVYIRGSLPPGRTNIVWMYDLDKPGTEMDLELPLAFRTYAVRVEVEAPPGMTLDVEGLPEPQLTYWEGTRVLVTEGRREGDDTSSQPIQIRLRGLPGVSFVPWIATGAVVVLLFLALLFLLMKGRGYSKESLASLRRERTDELLDEAAEIQKMFVADEIGPKYRERRMAEVRDELAEILRDEAAATAASKAPTAQPARRPAGSRLVTALASLGAAFALGGLLVTYFFAGFLFLVGFNIAKEELAEMRAGRLGSADKGKFVAVQWISFALAATWLISIWVFGTWAAITLMSAV
jgi:hypothetical protein